MNFLSFSHDMEKGSKIKLCAVEGFHVDPSKQRRGSTASELSLDRKRSVILAKCLKFRCHVDTHTPQCAARAGL